MRNLCLLLLLINFLAFVYQAWILEPDTAVAPLYIEQDYPGLAVANPMPAVVPEPATSAPTETAAADAVAYRCLKIGPFAQEPDADSVRQMLQSREATVRQTAEEGQVWVGHWVQVTGLGTRAQAEAARDRLVGGGIPDAYIVPGADDNKVSLGVFRARVSADSTVRRAARLGFETRIVERYQPGTSFWLRVRLPADRKLKTGELRTDTGQILRTESMPCSEAGV